MIVNIEDDFDLEKIAGCGQCFRAKRIQGGFRFVSQKKVLTIINKDDGIYDIDADEKEWESFWKNYFDLSVNYRNIRESIDQKDKFLFNASKLGKGIRILRQDKFEMLISFIISQRKNIPAISKSVEAICTKFGEKITHNGEVIYSFPSPKALFEASDNDLRKCALGYRVPYVKDAAFRVYSNQLDLDAIGKLDDDSLKEKLKSVKGVGNKVADCICLFAYHRLAASPVDVWIKRAIDEHYGGVNPFDSYGKYAGVMQQYIFYAYKK